MNVLVVGSDKSAILRHLPERYLFIDDGPLADAIHHPKRRAVRYFDTERHHFNPHKDMDYLRAREFVAVLDAVFPEGENTLTTKRTRFQILDALLSNPRSLATLISDTKDTEDAYQKIQMLLLSPVLKRVLERPTNFSFLTTQEGRTNGPATIIAKLDRATLGDFDAFVLGNLLISQYPGTVVVPDFGFYATRAHSNLIRQGRLIAGINFFDEVPSLRNELLLIPEKVAARPTPDDAEMLAVFAGHQRGTEGFSSWVQLAIA